jgi:hypothetical protein
VRRWEHQNISLEWLMKALVPLDQHVEIIVLHGAGRGITVAP